MSRPKKIFTLREAQSLLPEVQSLTAKAAARADRISEQMDGMQPSDKRVQLEAQYNALVRGWAEQVLDLGCEVKGLWLVDFDSGDGLYYCWHHPEAKLEYFHDYDAGFAGRRPIGPLMVG